MSERLAVHENHTVIYEIVIEEDFKNLKQSICYPS